MTALTYRQLLVLRSIAAFYERHGYAPTIPQIGRMALLSSTASVSYQLGRLVEMGWLEQVPRRQGTWHLLLTPGVRTVPVVRCGPCGGDMPADHVCRAVTEDLQRYGTPGDLADT